MRIVLFQPDIPQNTGNIIRLAACFGLKISIIRPIGFFFDDRKMKRSMMDYYKNVRINMHVDWDDFYKWSVKNKSKLILLTTKGKKKYTEYKFNNNDSIILGRESAGVPQEVHKKVKERLLIPMCQGLRSFNVSSAAAIVVGEAIRQLKKF